MPTKLSVTVITRNEAPNIGAALASVAWADEIIVVDSGSTDETIGIARLHTDRVYERDWTGYIDQKNHAAALASHDWILSLDADERVTTLLADEIRTLLAGEPAQQAFRIPRVTWYMGRWIRATDWYPDYQRRLYDRRCAQWTGRYVHETLAVQGDIGQLRGELQHYTYRDLNHHLEKIERYATLAARQMFDDGKRAGLLQLAARPPFAFLRNYIFHRGFRAGVPGFIISTLNAYYVFMKYAKLWELRHGSRNSREPDAPMAGPIKNPPE